MAVGEPLATEAADELLSFEPLEGEKGFEIVDRIERRHCPVITAGPVDPKPIPTDQFQFPVSKSISIETSAVTLPHRFMAIVWNSLGFMIAELTKGESRTFPPDRYSIDPGASIKTYISFNNGFSIHSTRDGIDIQFDSKTSIDIGVRSHHKHPATAITTTRDISDLMEAVSWLSSSLKILSCERSYPTLRGHPPTIELSDELRIPSFLSRPQSDVTIEIPPRCRFLFEVSPLSYYLGAKITSGSEPNLITPNGNEYQFGSNHESFDESVERVLKQLFFFDCVTRTEGLYQVNLYERKQIEKLVDIQFSQLYNEPLSEQIEAYLSIPFRTIAPYLPRWKLTAHVPPAVDKVSTLPFIINELGLVKTGSVSRTNSKVGRDTTKSKCNQGREFRIDETDSIETVWLGRGMPIGASKGMMAAYENRLGRNIADDDIDITVVCNAEEMSGEVTLIDSVYGSRAEIPFDVSIHSMISTEDLRVILQQEAEFLHFIGHIDSDGFECPDGRFDAASLQSTGIDMFFLNACTSYRQGRNLINAGSIGGVVTLNDVINSGAERVGGTLARLLNCGFPLQAALNIAREESIMGGHYLVIGDGGMMITQPDGSAPAVPELERLGTEWRIRYVTFPTSERGMGTITNPDIEQCNEFFLNSGENGEFTLTPEEMSDFLELREMPLWYSGEVRWSSEFDPVAER